MRLILSTFEDFGTEAAAGIAAIRNNIRFSPAVQQDTGSPAAVQGDSPAVNIPDPSIFAPDVSASGQVPIVSVPAPVASYSWLWLIVLGVVGYWLYRRGYLRGAVSTVKGFFNSAAKEI